LVAGSTDGKTRIWDVENVREPVLAYEFGGHTGSVTGVDLHPELPIVASGSTDGTIILRELKT
jgi:WD40 repeat protein